ncbi:MAG TPA: glycosyltransferase family 39 protein, partial [Chthoniobacterales bacterium]
MPSSGDRPMYLVAVFIALLQAWMALTAVNTKSPTFDEPQHLTAGYSYFVTKDFRLDPENGNLPAMWAALPLLFDDLKFVPLNDRGWQRAEEGRTAHQFFYEVGNDSDRMIAQARVMMSIFGAALCLLVYRIAREFFGVIGGLIAEIAVAFDPNFLAHSPLVDSDVPAALFFTATVWTCWRLFQKITPVRLMFAALSLSALFLTKFSAPLVLPVLAAMSILKISSNSEIALEIGRFRALWSDKWKKAGAVAASWLIVVAVLFVAIWGSCSFRYAAWTDNRADHEGTSWHWNYLLENDSGPVSKTVRFAREHRLLPEAYLYGMAYVRKHEIDRPAYLDNQWSIVGFRSFFPRAFLYKTPLPFLILLALAIYAAIATHRSWKIERIVNPLWGFALVYGAFAMTAQLNIGHRHILPIYPALFVASAAVVRFFNKNYRVIFASAVAILLAWQIGESFASRPNYLAYFNQIAGGPSRGYQHLVDSSLDWGQDLPGLKTWIDDHRAIVDQKPVYLAYFGTADP